jgi:hypothetical protein
MRAINIHKSRGGGLDNGDLASNKVPLDLYHITER